MQRRVQFENTKHGAQMSEFTTKNAAARHRPADDGSQLDVRDMRRLVQALPQYRCPRLIALCVPLRILVPIQSRQGGVWSLQDWR